MNRFISLAISLLLSASSAAAFHGGPRHDFRPAPPPPPHFHCREGYHCFNPWVGAGLFSLGALTAVAIEESRSPAAPVIVTEPQPAVIVSPSFPPPPPPPEFQVRWVWQDGYWEILPNGTRVWHPGFWRKIIQ